MAAAVDETNCVVNGTSEEDKNAYRPPDIDQVRITYLNDI